MDIQTIFGIGGFVGGILNGAVGYLNRPAEEKFSIGKFTQTLIVSLIVGLTATMAAIGMIDPNSSVFTVFAIGLLTGWGADAARNMIGIKK